MGEILQAGVEDCRFEIFSCAGGSAHSREELQELRQKQEREQQLKAKYAGVYRKVELQTSHEPLHMHSFSLSDFL